MNVIDVRARRILGNTPHQATCLIIVADRVESYLARSILERPLGDLTEIFTPKWVFAQETQLEGYEGLTGGL